MEPTQCRSPAIRTRLADFLAARRPGTASAEPMLSSRLSLALALVGALTARPPRMLAPGGLTAAPSGLEPASSTASVRPGDDFFRYANGKWLGTTANPTRPQRVGRLRRARGAAPPPDAGDPRGRGSLEARPRGSLERKVGDFYASAMDEAAAESKGIAPLKPDALAHRRHEDEGRPGHLPRRRAPRRRGRHGLHQLPDLAAVRPLGGARISQSRREACLSSSRAASACRIASTTFHRSDHGRDPRQVPRARREDPRARGHQGRGEAGRPRAGPRDEDGEGPRHPPRVARGQERQQPLAADRVGEAGSGPGLDALLRGRRAGGAAGGRPWHPKATAGLVGAGHARATRRLEGLGDLPRRRPPLGVPRQGLPGRGVRLLRQRARRDGRAAPRAGSGPRPGWTTSVGEAVGRLFVERHFSPQAKAKASEMVRSIAAAFVRRIDALDWMAPSTKAEAKAKVQALYVGVGYPDHWAGLVGPRGPARRPRRQRGPRRALPSRARAREARQAGGPERVVHGSARPSTR